MAYEAGNGSDTGKESGAMLAYADIDEVAVRIVNMWTNYNTDKTQCLKIGEEARQYIFAMDINSTSGAFMPHKNRTHQPKLTQISDTLQSWYWDASLSTSQFFKFDGTTDADKQKAYKVESWVRTKLEQQKFRQTVGRQLLADYVNYGNCFAAIDYVTERDDAGKLIYRGPKIFRVSPLDVVFNVRAVSFRKSPKLERKLIHCAEIAELPEMYPQAGFDQKKINKALEMRGPTYVDDWVQMLKERGLSIDGFGGFDDYFKQDMCEILIYRGDVFDPTNGEHQRNRVIYVMDRCHVIRNAPSRSPKGFDGLHHAGWRVRNDNLWAQGPLDNLIGMQYRINHLENLKADVFDLIAYPVVKIKGPNVIEPAQGFGPGRVYRCDMEEDVEIIAPESNALRAETEVQLYHKMMEDFSGTPPESRGQRTPGEKTAFEVSKLDANATKMFVDKARAFELMIETVLEEFFHLLIMNFDEVDYIETFNDVTGAQEVREITQRDVLATGQFVAMGSEYWSRRNKETVEMQQFMQGPLQDPKIRAHVNGQRLAEFFEKRMGMQDENIIEPFAGIKEDVQIALIAEAEKARLSQSVPGGVQPPQTPSDQPSPAQPLQSTARDETQNPITANLRQQF